MPKKYHIHPKSAPLGFDYVCKFKIVRGENCINCGKCTKVCIYEAHKRRKDDVRRMADPNTVLCRNCFRCIQECPRGALEKSLDKDFAAIGGAYWKPDMLLSLWKQAEDGKVPVSGAGYRGPFSGTGFDSMWTDMSEIVRPTRDGIHGREYISTAVDIGKVLKRVSLTPGAVPPRVESSVPILFDLLPFGEFNASVRMAMAQAAQEANLLMVVRAEQIDGEMLPFVRHLVPLLPEGSLTPYIPAIAKARMVQIVSGADHRERIAEIKRINPGVIVSLRLALTARTEDEAVELERAGAEVLHILADDWGRETESASPRFIKDMIRNIHLRLVREGRRDGITLIFGGGIALAEHVAKAIICGADAVSISRPLLIALACRLCERCEEAQCPVELGRMETKWGRQRIVNLVVAWHGQLLEVLGAMGIRDLRRLRGETGRAIFREEMERETFERIFAGAGPKAGAEVPEMKLPEGGNHVFPA